MARKVRGFGDVEPLGDGALRPGGQFLLYVELRDWPFLPGIGDMVRAHARYRVIVLDAAGAEVLKEGPFDASQSSPTPNPDLFITRMVTVPKTMAPGAYTLRVEVRDMATGVESNVTVPFTVSAPAKRGR
jgi:hypothetical protein